MTAGEQSGNRVRGRRQAASWTQAELAERARVSRSAIAAIENERLVPSVEAALGIAAALGCSVEELFGFGPSTSRRDEPIWAWDPPAPQWRAWGAEVGGRTLLFPIESDGPTAWQEPDATDVAGAPTGSSLKTPSTLVLAGCDPVAGTLARLYEQMTGFRMLVIPRSSRQSLELLAGGLVHVAGMHLATSEEPTRNAEAIAQRIEEPVTTVRLADWEEGLAVGSRFGTLSIRSLVRSRARWVGRDVGSGARQCMEERLPATIKPAHLARDHRAVAEAIRSGWADAGVCLRLSCEEAGLVFWPLQTEYFELAFRSELQHDPRIQGLLRVLRSAEHRRSVSGIPGYSCSRTGEMQALSPRTAPLSRST